MRDLGPSLAEGASLVHPSLRAAINVSVHETYPHPWFAQETRVPWSTIRRIGELVLAAPECWVDASGSGAPTIVSPLYAQPVVERCLRIPLDVHLYQGRERGLARHAFASALPASIVNRAWKDRAPGTLERLLLHNREYLRERLLDGALVREHLLDRAALERALEFSPTRAPTLPGEVLQHLDTELWARHWLP
jgi:asparagine synthase (glutamine-hydrolysing)